MSAAPRIAALVVTHQTGPRLFECLYGLRAEPGISEIIIADNGNPPALRQRLQRFCEAVPAARWLTVPNEGFGAGVNRAAKATSADWLLVINPDAVIRPRSIAPLLAALEGAARPAIAGGKIFGPDGREARGGRRRTLTLSTALGLKRWALNNEPPPKGPVPVGAVSGAFLMLRRDDFESLGGFDEGYFLHVEDVDLCRRALEAGGSVTYQPLAAALHYSSTSDVSSRSIAVHKTRSLARYFRKYARHPLERLTVEIAIPLMALALRLGPRRA